MLQAVTSTLLLYADNSCVLYQHKDKQIEKRLNEDFENLCDWFVDNKVFILVRIRQNLFILQVNGEQRISVT